MSETTGYRSDIDGLRALAVIAIVLFHARVPGFGGGFVGVDVFYVISGFLITRIIDSDILDRRFSIADFYERRALRILPAFFAMLAVVLLLGFVVLTPPDLRSLGKSTIGAAIFGSNVVFFNEAGYFNTASNLKPLLHTWSLGVEEQFYILFPLILIILRRSGRRPTVIGVAAIGLSSFVLGLTTTDRWPVFAFFMFPARAWELTIGALIALGVPPMGAPRAVREFGAAAGLALTLYSIFAFNNFTPFPGLAALVPLVGSGLLIWGGQGTLTGGLFSWRPLRAIGLISYSLYLWHWPVVVFWEYLSLHNLRGWESIGAISLAAALASISTYWLERPFRRGVIGRPTLFLGAFVMSAAAVVIGGALVALHGLPQRNEIASRFGVAAGTERAAFMASPCLVQEYGSARLDACTFNADGPGPMTVLWGDSHAAQYAAALHAMFDPARRPWIEMTKSGCPPIPTPSLFPRDRLRSGCPAFDAAAFKVAEATPSGSTIVIAARWDSVIDGELAFAADTVRPGQAASDAAAIADLRRTLWTLTATGHRVIVLGQVPIPPQDVEACLARAVFDHRPWAGCGAFGPEEIKAARSIDERTWRFVSSAVEGIPGVATARPWSRMCGSGLCQMVGPEGALYLDATHLSMAGAKRVLSGLPL